MAISPLTIAQVTDLSMQSGDGWPLARPIRFACLAQGASARHLRTIVEAFCSIKSNRATELHVFGDARSDHEMQTMSAARAIAEQRNCKGIWFDGDMPMARLAREDTTQPINSDQLHLADVVILAPPANKADQEHLEIMTATAKPLILLGESSQPIVIDRQTGRVLRRPAVESLVEAMQEIAFNPAMLQQWHLTMLRKNLTAASGPLSDPTKLPVQ